MQDSSDDESSEDDKKVVAKAQVGQKRDRAASNVSTNSKNGKVAKKDTKAVPAKKAPVESDSDSDSSEEDTKKKPVAKAAPVKAVAKKVVAKDSSDDSDSDSDVEVLKKPAAKAVPAKKAAAKKDSDSDSDSDAESSEEEKPVRKASNVSQTKKTAKKVESEEEEVEEVENGDAADPDADKKELFVGNLAFTTTEDSLGEAFGQYGSITNIKMPQNMGKPKGFAFVEFATHKEAKAALDALNGQEVDGRNIRINFSGGAPAAGGAGNGFAPRGERPSGGDGTSTTLFVGNMSFRANE